MTAAIILGGGGVVSLIAACVWATKHDEPQFDARVIAWIVLSVFAVAASMWLAALDQPRPSRSAEIWTIAPIAGAPLVRVHDASWPRVSDAHALVAEPAQRRLLIAADDAVLP